MECQNVLHLMDKLQKKDSASQTLKPKADIQVFTNCSACTSLLFIVSLSFQCLVCSFMCLLKYLDPVYIIQLTTYTYFPWLDFKCVSKKLKKCISDKQDFTEFLHLIFT